jgi:tetratricopeptide (TPR) repeat protein
MTIHSNTPEAPNHALQRTAPAVAELGVVGVSSRLMKYIVAIAACLSLNACHAEDAKALVQAGTEKYRAQDFDGAITDFTKAIEADPTLGDAYKSRGLSKSLKGDWKGCWADINSALALAPENVEFLSTRAFTHLHLSDFPAAKADFATIGRLDPKNGPNVKLQTAQGLISRARSKSFSGDNAAAIKDLDMVLALFPELGVAYHERGGAKSDLKQYKEAIADFDLAIKFDEWHNEAGDSYTLRARAKRALGDTAGADADDKEAEKRASK